MRERLVTCGVGGLFGVGPGQQEYEFPVVPVDLPLRAEVADYPTDFAAMSEAMTRIAERVM